MFSEFTLLVLKNDNTTTTTNRFGARCYDFVAFVVVDNVYRLHRYVVHCPIKISVLHGSRLYFVQYIYIFYHLYVLTYHQIKLRFSAVTPKTEDRQKRRLSFWWCVFFAVADTYGSNKAGTGVRPKRPCVTSATGR